MLEKDRFKKKLLGHKSELEEKRIRQMARNIKKRKAEKKTQMSKKVRKKSPVDQIQDIWGADLTEKKGKKKRRKRVPHKSKVMAWTLPHPG